MPCSPSLLKLYKLCDIHPNFQVYLELVILKKKHSMFRHRGVSPISLFYFFFRIASSNYTNCKIGCYRNLCLIVFVAFPAFHGFFGIASLQTSVLWNIFYYNCWGGMTVRLLTCSHKALFTQCFWNRWLGMLPCIRQKDLKALIHRMKENRADCIIL